jgi:hypothetical protein
VVAVNSTPCERAACQEPSACPSASGPRRTFISRCSRTAQVLLHSANGSRICSRTASCSSNAVNWVLRASMLRRCAATLVVTVSSCAAEEAPGASRRRWEGPTQPGQALQSLGGSAELSDELLHQVRTFDGRALLIIGHRLLLSEKIITVSPVRCSTAARASDSLVAPWGNLPTAAAVGPDELKAGSAADRSRASRRETRPASSYSSISRCPSPDQLPMRLTVVTSARSRTPAPKHGPTIYALRCFDRPWKLRVRDRASKAPLSGAASELRTCSPKA